MNLDAVLAAIARRRVEIDRHPLYTWMASGDAPLEQRFVYAPLFANFILGFRDMNRWFMRYPEPSSIYEKAINAHTEEDETHSALFLEDWRELGLDAQLGWGVQDTIAWYYAASETEVFRRYAMRIIQMCVETPDPLVRFGFMEAIETCGHVFFGHTAPLAEELARRTGSALRYFGPFHLAKETGALIDADDVFESVILTAEQRRQAIELVEEVFDMFTVKNDHLLRYALAITSGSVVLQPASAALLRLTLGELEEVPPIHSIELAAPSVAHRPMAELVHKRMQGLRMHPFMDWVATPTADPAGRLREYLPPWIPDIMGYADLMTYALPFTRPRNAVERALNRHAILLTSHHRLFIKDAAALDLDGALRWTAGETLNFLGRGEATELQRRSMALFVDIAFRYPSPVVRYWLMEALQRSGEAFFHQGSKLARAAETQLGARLDYLADRHRLAHPTLGPDPEADAVVFTRLPVTAHERQAALRSINTVFDRVENQFDQSLQEVEPRPPTSIATS